MNSFLRKHSSALVAVAAAAPLALIVAFASGAIPTPVKEGVVALLIAAAIWYGAVGYFWARTMDRLVAIRIGEITLHVTPGVAEILQRALAGMLIDRMVDASRPKAPSAAAPISASEIQARQREEAKQWEQQQQQQGDRGVLGDPEIWAKPYLDDSKHDRVILTIPRSQPGLESLDILRSSLPGADVPSVANPPPPPVAAAPPPLSADFSLADIKALQPVHFATNREVRDGDFSLGSITSERARNLTLGRALVSIPIAHKIGVVERPAFNWFRLRWEKEQDAKHFRLRSLERLALEAFTDGIKNAENSVLVFVHGYNVSFDEAIFKAAQIAFDANFDGSVVAFSWPSRAGLLDYDFDRESALYSASALVELLKIIKLDAKIENVFLVAHSLGSQVVVDALQQAALSHLDFNLAELVLAAPDVDRDVFTSRADQIRAVAAGITIYASSADKALRASKLKAGGVARAGDMPATGPLLIPGFDLIDVTAVGEDMFALNHGIFASDRSVLDDLGRIVISRTRPPHKRTPTLRARPTRKEPHYWEYPR